MVSNKCIMIVIKHKYTLSLLWLNVYTRKYYCYFINNNKNEKSFIAFQSHNIILILLLFPIFIYELICSIN